MPEVSRPEVKVPWHGGYNWSNMVAHNAASAMNLGNNGILKLANPDTKPICMILKH